MRTYVDGIAQDLAKALDIPDGTIEYKAIVASFQIIVERCSEEAEMWGQIGERIAVRLRSFAINGIGPAIKGTVCSLQNVRSS